MPERGDLVADRYRLGRKVGHGGMGVVFEADNLAVGSKVAIKFLLPEALDNPSHLCRFQREARATAGISHPNVVYVFDLGAFGDECLPFIVMELLHGEPLSSVLRFAGPLAADATTAIGLQLLDAIAVAHARGVIHRDLKPSNLFLVEPRGEHVKVLDFGISKLLPDADQLTNPGLVMGTPAYMPPEQAMGLPVDHRVDLYGAGAVLYEALTGQPPYGDLQPAAVLMRMMSGRAPPVRSLRPDVDVGLAAVIERALERRPEERWASAIEMHAALLESAPRPACFTERRHLPERALARSATSMSSTPFSWPPAYLPEPEPAGPARARMSLTESVVLVPTGTERFDPPSAGEAVPTTPRTKLPRLLDHLVRRNRVPLAALISLVPFLILARALLGWAAGDGCTPHRPVTVVAADRVPTAGPANVSPAMGLEAVRTAAVIPTLEPPSPIDEPRPRSSRQRARRRDRALGSAVLEPNPFR